MQNWTEQELDQFAMYCIGSPTSEMLVRITQHMRVLLPTSYRKTVRELDNLYAETPRGTIARAVPVAKFILKRGGFTHPASGLAVIAASHFGLSYRHLERLQLVLIERDIEFVTAGDKADGQVSQSTRIAVRPVIGGGRQIVRESFEDDDTCVLAILSVDDAFRLRQIGIDLASR